MYRLRISPPILLRMAAGRFDAYCREPGAMRKTMMPLRSSPRHGRDRQLGPSPRSHVVNLSRRWPARDRLYSSTTLRGAAETGMIADDYARRDRMVLLCLHYYAAFRKHDYGGDGSGPVNITVDGRAPMPLWRRFCFGLHRPLHRPFRLRRVCYGRLAASGQISPSRRVSILCDSASRAGAVSLAEADASFYDGEMLARFCRATSRRQ